MHRFSYSGSTWDFRPLGNAIAGQDIANSLGMAPGLSSAGLCLHACVAAFTGIKNSLLLRDEYYRAKYCSDALG